MSTLVTSACSASICVQGLPAPQPSSNTVAASGRCSKSFPRYSSLAGEGLLGNRDPDTVARHQEAVTLREAIFGGASEKYGRSHPRTVLRCLELGKCYEALGRPGDALSLYQQFSDQPVELEEAEQPMLAEVGGWIADLQHLLAGGQGGDQRQEYLHAQEYAYADNYAIEEEEDESDESSTELGEGTGAGSV